jgi:hypothetical protein
MPVRARCIYVFVFPSRKTIAMTRVQRPDGGGQSVIVAIPKDDDEQCTGAGPDVDFHQNHLKEFYMRARKTDNYAWTHFRFERTPGHHIDVDYNTLNVIMFPALTHIKQTSGRRTIVPIIT